VLVTGIGRGFAMNAGLRPGDIIREVNGRKTGSVKDLAGVVATPARAWQVTIERGGQQITAQFRT
jgi:S1-C subfamily serine protease